jgi:hypothetical protein
MVRKSAVKGFTLRHGKITRIPAAKRIHMRIVQRRAARKRKAHMQQTLRKRKQSMRKRKAYGIHEEQIMQEITNRLRGKSVIRLTETGAVTINLSQLSANTNTENVFAATISSMRWSLHPSTGVLVVTRQNVGGGANVLGTFYGTGHWPGDDHNFAGSNTITGNLTLNMTTAGVVEVVVRKEANYNVETQAL